MTTTTRKTTKKGDRDEMLPVKLTAAEMAARARKAAQTQSDEDIAEEEEKTRRGEHKAAVERMQTTIRQCLDAIRTGTEMRHIAVLDRKDFEAGVMEVVRTDTGSVVRTRALTTEERQPNLRGLGGGKGDDKKKPAGPQDAKK